MAQKAKEKNTTAKKSGKSRVDNTVKNPNEQPEKSNRFSARDAKRQRGAGAGDYRTD